MTPSSARAKTPEHERLEEARTGAVRWKAWGPYLSERQWGTVREDYSAGGDAWNYFPHDQARSRAYRWGEDGIAGICDERQRLCLALALWNGADPILKERMFGLTNSEGNHGEDVKEYWFYLDSTPTHSYMKCQYKYPQRAFPYEDLLSTNGRRGKQEMEYELLDTGIFDEDRYFDVVVEYAKGAPRRHPDARHGAQPRPGRRDPASAAHAVVPQHLVVGRRGRQADPAGRRRGAGGRRGARLSTRSSASGCCAPTRRRSCCSARTRPTTSGCSERRTRRRMSRTRSTSSSCMARAMRSTRSGRVPRSRPITCWRCRRGTAPRFACGLTASGGSQTDVPGKGKPLGSDFDRVFKARRKEADKFYATVIPPTLRRDGAMVMRQALAGLLWGKQYYEYNVHRWLREHGVDPWGPNAAASAVRNVPWFHMVAGDVISMPDKWEYPWFAAWDLAFHCAPLSLVDVDFAKAAGRAAAEHPVSAPQRPDPGVRVELQSTSTRR